MIQDKEDTTIGAVDVPSIPVGKENLVPQNNIVDDGLILREFTSVQTDPPKSAGDYFRIINNKLYFYQKSTGTWIQPGTLSPMTDFNLYEDFVGGNNSDGTIGTNGWSIDNATSNAVFSGQDGETGRPGIFEITMATSTNGNGTIYCGKSTGLRTDQANMTMEASLKLANTSSVYCSVGITMTPGGDDVTGIYFKLDTGVDGKWYGYTRNNSSATATATGVTATTNWTKFKFVSNDSGTSFEFFIDDVSLGTITSTIPTQKAHPHVMLGIRSATAKSVKIDYYNISVSSLGR